MTRFLVIENTPGYLPENEPYETDDYAEAVRVMNETVEEYAEQIREADATPTIEWGIASRDNYAAAIVYRSDRMHDLGVSFEVVQDTE